MVHVIERAKDRFGVELSSTDVRLIEQAGREGRTLHLADGNGTCELHEVIWNGRRLCVLFDQNRDGIAITCMTLRMLYTRPKRSSKSVRKAARQAQRSETDFHREEMSR